MTIRIQEIKKEVPVTFVMVQVADGATEDKVSAPRNKTLMIDRIEVVNVGGGGGTYILRQSFTDTGGAAQTPVIETFTAVGAGSDEESNDIGAVVMPGATLQTIMPKATDEMRVEGRLV